MTKEKLIETIKKILAIDHDLSFLARLTETEIETLVASIRQRLAEGGISTFLLDFRCESVVLHDGLGLIFDRQGRIPLCSRIPEAKFYHLTNWAKGSSGL